ncbi:MAG: hypothetical protein K6T28_08055 [Acidothermus sp.]|nr:hypothetical protein [Acidothermus sp.]
MLFRAWRLKTVCVAAAASVIAWFAIPARPIDVPGRDGVSSVLWPLLPAVVASALPSVLEWSRSPAVVLAPRSRTDTAGRIGFATLLVGAVAIVGATRFDPVVVLRNSAFLFGLATLLSRWTASGLVATMVVLVPMAMWLLGTEPGGFAKSWALLLLDAHSPTAGGFAIGLFVTGACAQVLPSRSKARTPE